jgi:hypothetical protein
MALFACCHTGQATCVGACDISQAARALPEADAYTQLLTLLDPLLADEPLDLSNEVELLAALRLPSSLRLSTDSADDAVSAAASPVGSPPAHALDSLMASLAFEPAASAVVAATKFVANGRGGAVDAASSGLC